jgi:hypothetical protein
MLVGTRLPDVDQPISRTIISGVVPSLLTTA